MFLTLLLIIHVLCVIVWIGGVAFVTTVIFPMMYRTEGSLEKALMFQRVEHRFAVLGEPRGIGIVIMIFAWAFYTTVLLSERRIFSRIFADPEKIDMDKALKLINAMHWFLLTISFSAVAGGIWFGHAG